MKANTIPQLDSKWWSKNKPLTLKKTGLGDALSQYETARDAFEKIAKSSSTDFSGHEAYMEAKSILGGEVTKCVNVGLKVASKTLHKETIAALEKYISNVIPAEKKRLDSLFETVKKANETAANRSLSEYDKLLAAWQVMGENSAKMVLAARKESATLEDILTEAADAARKGVVEEAKKAAGRAEVLADKLKAMCRSVENDLKKVSKLTADVDGKSLDPKQKKEFDKKSDKRMTYEQQTKNNIKSLTDAVKAAEDIVKECQQVVSGGADLVKLYLKMMDNLVNRAFRYAQQDIDVSSRECSGATANVTIALENFEAAKNETDQNEAKERAVRFLKHAITQADALKKALDRARKDVDKSLDGMPRDIVTPTNDAFVRLFNDLEKAMKIFDDETRTLDKQVKKIKELGPKVKALNS